MRILLVDVDTLRADHTGPYGYSRRITPNLDALARDAVVFERVYASDSPCAPSRAAWTSVQFGITTGAIGNFGPAADLHLFERTKHAPFFGSHLYRHGLRTASLSCFPDRHYAYWFVANFLEWRRPSMSSGDDEDAAVVTDRAIEWLRAYGREDDWLLHVHYWDPHLPYLEPTRWYDAAMEAGAPPAWPDEEAVARHQEECYGPHTALDLYEGDGSWSLPPPRAPNPDTMPDAIRRREDVVRFVTGYDGAVAYFDHHLGRLLGELDALGVFDETAVAVVSDHGECLGEHGCYGDHPFTNHASHHVPLVVRWPGLTDRLAPEHRRVRGLAYHFDLCPTICELIGVPVPEGWEGCSFAAAVRGDPWEGRAALVLSHGAYTYGRSVLRADGWLLLTTRHPGCFRLPRRALYRIDEDPHETRDLLEAEPALASELDTALAAWREEHLSMASDPKDPMDARRYEGPMHAFAVDRYAARLRATGRAHLAEELLRRFEEAERSVGSAPTPR
jgi:arylsulfatase A-like enzyme